MLDIKNLHVSVEGVEILKGIDLTVNKGEVYAYARTGRSSRLQGHERFGDL